MDTTSNILEQKELNLHSLQDDNSIRCLSSGMGSHMQRNVNQGSLVSTGVDPTQQLLGARGSYSGSLNLCKGEVRHLNPVEDRQHNYSSLINRRKGRTESHTLLHLARTLWLWCMERNITLEAQYIPGVMNSIADRESRTWSDRSDQKL